MNEGCDFLELHKGEVGKEYLVEAVEVLDKCSMNNNRCKNCWREKECVSLWDIAVGNVPVWVHNKIMERSPLGKLGGRR